jgi:pimeloyl-ACP methyl ester carboxylesterase
MSALANSHPSRLAGLVYLDAAYPYAFDDGSGRTMREFDPPKALWHPSPGAPDLEGFRSLQAWDERVDGFPTPEAEFHELWEWDAGGEVLKRRNFLGGRVFSTILTEGTRYTRIPAPALALYALPHTPEAWIRKSTDPAVQKAARAYFATIDALTEKQARAFERLVPGARVVRMPGSHYLFLSNAPEVLRQVRTFIDGLR